MRFLAISLSVLCALLQGCAASRPAASVQAAATATLTPDPASPLLETAAALRTLAKQASIDDVDLVGAKLDELLQDSGNTERARLLLALLGGPKGAEEGLAWPAAFSEPFYEQVAGNEALKILFLAGPLEQQVGLTAYRLRLKSSGGQHPEDFELLDDLEPWAPELRWRLVEMVYDLYPQPNWLRTRLVMQCLRLDPHFAKDKAVLRRLRNWNLVQFLLDRPPFPEFNATGPCDKARLRGLLVREKEGVARLCECGRVDLDGDSFPEDLIAVRDSALGGRFSLKVYKEGKLEPVFRSEEGRWGSTQWVTNKRGTFLLLNIDEDKAQGEPNALQVWAWVQGKPKLLAQWEGSSCVRQAGCQERAWFRVDGAETHLERWYSGETLRPLEMADKDFRIRSQPVYFDDNGQVRLGKQLSYRSPYYLDIYPPRLYPQ